MTLAVKMKPCGLHKSLEKVILLFIINIEIFCHFWQNT
jgi:hypothetical protein